jgi:multisubunit Na+/H+ antiporter MnhG subunit
VPQKNTSTDFNLSLYLSFTGSIGLIRFFFFQKKKQKALFRFAEGHSRSKPRRGLPLGWGLPKKNTSTDVNLSIHLSLTGSIGLIRCFFFQKKKQKALFRFAEEHSQSKPRRGLPLGWGLPKKNTSTDVNLSIYLSLTGSIGLIRFFFFQKKKQKALFRFVEGHNLPKNLDEADLGVWELTLNKGHLLISLCQSFFIESIGSIAFFFSRKEAEEYSLLKSRRSRPRGVWGASPPAEHRERPYRCTGSPMADLGSESIGVHGTASLCLGRGPC